MTSSLPGRRLRMADVRACAGLTRGRTLACEMVVAQRVGPIIDVEHFLDVLPLDRLVQKWPGNRHIGARLEPAAVVVLQVALDDRVEQPSLETEQVAGDEGLSPRADKWIEMARSAAAAVGAAPVAPDDFPTLVILPGQPVQGVIRREMIVGIEHDHDVVAAGRCSGVRDRRYRPEIVAHGFRRSGTCRSARGC